MTELKESISQYFIGHSEKCASHIFISHALGTIGTSSGLNFNS